MATKKAVKKPQRGSAAKTENAAVGKPAAVKRTKATATPAPKKSESGKKPPLRKNVSQTVPNGRTIKTKDKYLPTDKKGKSENPKDKRWIAVISRNECGELAVVSLTTEKQQNTTELKDYKKGNGKTTYFKHFVEIEDNNGNPIKIDGVRFIENPAKYDLNKKQVSQVREKVFKHTKQAEENKKKITTLKSGDKKKR